MLNSTLCATERFLCCLVENWCDEEGFVVRLLLYYDDTSLAQKVSTAITECSNSSSETI